jgi:hypothetical protein
MRIRETGSTTAVPSTDQRAYVFNVDPVESDLRRAAKDDLERIAAGIKLRASGSGWAAELADRHNDLSESPWFYLLFLVVLVAEQALAVHLSFHVKTDRAARTTRLGTAQPTAA